MRANIHMRSLLVYSFCAVGAAGVSGASALESVPASGLSGARTSSITLQRGASFKMPLQAAAPTASAALPGRLRLPVQAPIGARKLQELKDAARLAGADRPGGEAVFASEIGAAGQAPQRAALTKKCLNVGASGGYAPSDSHGAVGPANIVTVKNVTVGVYAKGNCAVIAPELNLTSLFAGAGVPGTATLFDPRVIYDKDTKRFFLTAESMDSGNTDQYQYFAVSSDSTGTSWWIYRITMSEGTTTFCKQSYDSFWDYPSAGSSRGVNPATASGQGRWFITANDFGNVDVVGAVLSIDKAASLGGGSVNIKCFGSLAITNIAPPIVLDSATTSQFLSPGSGGGNAIVRLNLAASTSGAASDSLSQISNVSVTTWAAPPNAKQPNGELLDSIDGRFQSASIQSRGLIWNVHTIGYNGHAKVRLYRLSTSNSVTTPTMTFMPASAAGEDLFNPSFATSSGIVNAPAYMTMSRTISTNATAGRASTLIFSGVNNSSVNSEWKFASLGASPSQFTGCGSGCRWGDYSATQIDPSGDGTGWGFNQRITGTSEFDWTMETGSMTLQLPASPVAQN